MNPLDVIGYLVQCEVCPQRALLTVQLEGWVCPRCAEVVGTAADEHRACVQCGDVVDVGLSSREWCDGCESEDELANEALAEELRRAMEPPVVFTDMVDGIRLAPGVRTLAGFGDVDVAAAEKVIPAHPIFIGSKTVVRGLDGKYFIEHRDHDGVLSHTEHVGDLLDVNFRLLGIQPPAVALPADDDEYPIGKVVG